MKGSIMTGTEITCLCVAGAAFILIMLSLIFFAHSRKVFRRYTAQTTGSIVAHRFMGHDSGRRVVPVVEYTVNGYVYSAYRHFKGVVNSHRTSFRESCCEIFVSERDILHIKCVGMSVNMNEALEKLWPLGSSMTVFYDPDRPDRGYAEKVVTPWSVAGVVLLCVGLGLLALAGVFWLVF